jgi:hypothetical protein
VTLDQGRDTSMGPVQLWNIIPIHAFSEIVARTMFKPLWAQWPWHLNQRHNIFIGPGQQSCKVLFKFIKRVRSYGPDKLFAYVLTIMCIVTFDQGHDTSLGPGQQFCEILNQFINSEKSYGLDNVKNHCVYSDLDVWAVTVDQGRDTN